jgi:group I intron endonuclease
MYYLYLITNLVNWKQYVGITTRPKNRWCKHRTGLGSRLVKAAINKYGPESLRFAVIWKSPDRACIEWMERQAINELNTLSPHGYNRNAGGGGAPVGMKPSAEAIAKRAASNRGRKRSVEFRARMSALARGRLVSDATRQKMSAARKGHPAYEHQRAVASAASSKPVLINGQQFPSITAAAQAIGTSRAKLTKQFWRYKRENSFPSGWGYMAATAQRVS